MILKDLLENFEINVELPDYLLEHPFNEVFLKGNLTFKSNEYKIVAPTQKKVTHTMVIKSNSDFPVVVISELPNGSLNGIRFGRTEDDVSYINKF